MFDRRVYKNSRENSAVLARKVISKMLHDARDVQDSTRDVKVYLNLAITTDQADDISAWWKTVCQTQCNTGELDNVSTRESIIQSFTRAWCSKAPDNSCIELTAVYE